jgi:predicted kinase
MAKARSIYTTWRGNLRPGTGLVVNVRGPIGSGKTTLCRGLEGRPPWRFWYLDVDRALWGHPPDLRGDYIRTETAPELEIIALHTKMVLGRGYNVVLDHNFWTPAQARRLLRGIGRGPRDRRVALIRLTVDTDEAVRRKRTLKPSYVRASHAGFQLHPVSGEIVVDTSGKTPRTVLLEVRRMLTSHSRGDTVP